MAFLKWSDVLSVHVTEIDEQHQKLIQLINTLHDAMLEKKGKDVLANILDELAAYTVYHFSTEEKYMQQCNFPGLVNHKKEHDTFVGKVDSFIKDYQANRLGITIELMTFLKEWVSNHIQITDKKYSETFNKNGII